MKILLAVHHFPPDHTGGAEWQTYRTARAMQERGHTVRVVCIRRLDAGMDADLAWEDDTFQGVAVRRLDLNMRRAADPFRWQYHHPAVADNLAQLIREFQPNVFHLIGGYLLGVSALDPAEQAGIPRVVSLTDFWYICPRITLLKSDGTLSPLAVDPLRCVGCLAGERRRIRWLNRLFPGAMNRYWQKRTAQASRLQERLTTLRDRLNRVQVVIALSRFIQSVYALNGIRPEIMRASIQGVELPGLPKVVNHQRSNVLRMGYMGQIASHKGVHILLEALRCLPEAALELKIFGDGTKFPAYTRKLRKQYGGDDRVQWMGVFAREKIGEVLQQLDVVIVPSIWYENTPNVILESFTCGVPVIASNLGGMAELVQDGRGGMLFAPGDARDLARQVERLIADPALLSRLREGIPPVRTVEDEMDELEAIYCQLAAA